MKNYQEKNILTMNMSTMINSNKKTIAVLDLDMTIIDCQSTEIFVNHLKKKGIMED